MRDPARHPDGCAGTVPGLLEIAETRTVLAVLVEPSRPALAAMEDECAIGTPTLRLPFDDGHQFGGVFWIHGNPLLVTRLVQLRSQREHFVLGILVPPLQPSRRADAPRAEEEEQHLTSRYRPVSILAPLIE